MPVVHHQDRHSSVLFQTCSALCLQVRCIIEKHKGQGYQPKDFANCPETRVWVEYQCELRRSNLVDFGDMLQVSTPPALWASRRGMFDRQRDGVLLAFFPTRCSQGRALCCQPGWRCFSSFFLAVHVLHSCLLLISLLVQVTG